ncbi:hypothetical protein BNNNBJKE_00020 [Aeromonas phage vB_AdhM_DL]|nr:hypothetical protein BNCALIDO_00074 [Aeromonas phage vB_AdhM_TS9]WBF79604.1 hypothetical protein BNNNBJKE_00020 [Aeromonas phage vB_AdhM_DL]
MSEYKITKQLIKRFQDAIPEVKVSGMTTKSASVSVIYANGFEYKIWVHKVIDCMKEYTPSKNRTYMAYPISTNTTVNIDVPQQLYFVVDKLNDLVQTNQTEEKEIKQEFESHLQKFYSGMGWK